MEKIRLIIKSFVFSVTTTVMLIMLNFLILMTGPQSYIEGTYPGFFGAIAFYVITDDPEFSVLYSWELNFDQFLPVWLTLIATLIVYIIGIPLYTKYRSRKVESS